MIDEEFIWDFAKAHANLRKHGVSFKEPATVFKDPLALVIPDPDHSDVESRWLLLGRSGRLRLVVVVHVERGEWIRIISARKATRRERVQYEESPIQGPDDAG